MGAGAAVSSGSREAARGGDAEGGVLEGRVSVRVSEDGAAFVDNAGVVGAGVVGNAGVVCGPASVPVTVAVLASAPAAALAASGLRASGGRASDAAAPASGGSSALLVARSTVTLRTGSGALTGSLAPAGACGELGGPDNSSGTTSTMSSTMIDAPTRRSLTRRSIDQP